MTAYSYDKDYASVPKDDEAKYRDYRRREQWKKRAGQEAVNRSGACTDRPGCECPTCKDYSQMRERAHHFHYLQGMDWVDAWKAAGWGGGAETPFMNPGDKLTPAEAAAPPAEPRDWKADRFAELFTTFDEPSGNT